MSNNLKLVQIAKRDLNMDDDIYRDLLERITGQRSCKGLSDFALSKVVNEMKRKGFKPKQSKKIKLSPPSSDKVRASETLKIRAIWITMYKHGFVRNRSETALDAYVKRMTNNSNGKGVAKAAWLNSTQAYNVLEALKKWHYRLMAESIIKQGGRIPLNNDLTCPAGYDLLKEHFEDGYLQNKESVR